MKRISPRSIPPLFSLPAKGLLPILLLFLSSALPGAEAFSPREEARSASPLHAAAGFALPDRSASGVKNVETPPAETKSSQGLEEAAALRKRARRAADRYALSDEILFDHILARHGFKSTVPGKSRFVKGFDVRGGIDFVLKSADARIRANTEGRPGYIFEVTYPKKIGVSPEKKALKTLRVVIDEKGRVITAFPVK